MATLAGLVLVQLRMVWAVTVMGGIAKGDSAVSTCWVCDGRAGLPLGLLGWACFSCRLGHPIQRSCRGEAQLRNKKKTSPISKQRKRDPQSKRTRWGGSPSVERSRRTKSNESPPKPPTPGRPRARATSRRENDGRRRCGPRRRGHPPRGISNP